MVHKRCFNSSEGDSFPKKIKNSSYNPIGDYSCCFFVYLQSSIFICRRKAWASFRGVQIVMAQNECLRMFLPEFAEESHQGGFLQESAGVCRGKIGSESAFIADADTVLVVVLAMCAYGLGRTALMDFSVSGDVEVVTDVLEAAVADVVPPAVLHRKGFSFRGGTAMDDNQTDEAHGARYSFGFRSFRRWP